MNFSIARHIQCMNSTSIGWKSQIFPIETPILPIKVIDFGSNREPVYDFLLVINSNLGPISHRYWDTATY